MDRSRGAGRPRAVMHLLLGLAQYAIASPERSRGPWPEPMHAAPLSGAPVAVPAAPRARVPVLAALAWLYPVALLVALFVRWYRHGDPGILSGWLLVPAQVLSLFVMARMLARVPLPPWRRLAWRALAVAAVIDIAGNALWTWTADTTSILYGTLADVLFACNYVGIVVGLAAFFRGRGGRFRSTRVLVDALTLAIGIGASLLPFLVGPAFQMVGQPDRFVASIAYTLGTGATAIMGSLLYMQVMDWRAEPAIGWVLAATVVIVCVDAVAAGANLRDQYVFGGLDVIGSSIVYTLFTTGAYAEYRQSPSVPPDPAANVYGFLPVMSLFVAVAIVVGVQFQSPANVVLAAALLVVSAALILLRQLRVRYEIGRLNSALAAREAEARVSELVRRSADLIAVIDGQQRVRYVSPAAATLLGRPADGLPGTPATLMFGAEHEAAVAGLLAELGRSADGRAELELLLDDGERVLHLTASDESRNGLIEGTLLNVRDLSEQRRLERALLDIATRERERLCGDIHEGLGQQLTGISLYLRSLTVAASRSATRQIDASELDPVIKLVNSAIDQVRALARGFSPLEIVHRSLVSALRALATDVEHQFPVQVRLVTDVDPDALSAHEADHLYRIVQEAVVNACRHSQCTSVVIDVTVSRQEIRASVGDDGSGFVAGALEKDHLGVRMMRYRARLLGAALRFDSGAPRGTRVSLVARRRPRDEAISRAG